MTFREHLFDIIEPQKSKISKIFDLGIITLICLNVLAIVIESFKGLGPGIRNGLHIFEVFSVGVFSLEYLARLFTADLKFPGKTKAAALISYIFSSMALIDLFAVLPFYLPLFIVVDLRFIRILRLLRLARLLKLNRYSKALKVIGDIFKEKRADLGVTMFITFLLLLVASTIMYYLEGSEQPEAFPNIPATFWWAVATLTTVGYGDVYPITGAGKLVSGIIALLGIGMVALPTGILSAAYMEKMDARKKEEEANKECCPHCGQSIDHLPHVPREKENLEKQEV